MGHARPRTLQVRIDGYAGGMVISRRAALTLIAIGIALMLAALAPGMPKLLLAVGAALAILAAILLITQDAARR